MAPHESGQAVDTAYRTIQRLWPTANHIEENIELLNAWEAFNWELRVRFRKLARCNCESDCIHQIDDLRSIAVERFVKHLHSKEPVPYPYRFMCTVCHNIFVSSIRIPESRMGENVPYIEE